MSGQDGRTHSQAHGDDSPNLRSVPFLTQGLQAKTALPPPPAGFKAPLPSRSSLRVSKQEVLDQGVVQEWTACTSTAWIVKAEDLAPVPNGFPLEKTHCEIHEDVSVVSARISSALRSLSIESTFCSKTAQASCQTDDCVRFKISLFDGGDNGQPILVEVQKRCGPAFLFSRTCRVLLNAAKGVTPLTKALEDPKERAPARTLECLQGVVGAKSTHEGTIEQLNIVKRMLASVRKDEQLLALENLLCLTDSIKTSALVSGRISKAFLMDETLRSDVLLTTSQTDRFAERYESTSMSDRASFLSLAAFANALEQLRAGNSLSELVKADKWFAANLVPQLLDQISDENKLNTAHQGTRALSSLLEGGAGDKSETVKTVLEAGGTEILRKAHERGVRFHERLAQETKRCLDVVLEPCV